VSDQVIHRDFLTASDALARPQFVYSIKPNDGEAKDRRRAAETSSYLLMRILAVQDSTTAENTTTAKASLELLEPAP
jgi:hypothetical protein